MSCSLQVENARGNSWPACELTWNWPPCMALGTPLCSQGTCGIHGASCAWISEKKTPRGSHFSYISNISAKSQRAEVGRDFLRSPRQGQGQAEQDHVQLGFQYPHGENQALPHWQLLRLFLFSQTRLLRVFCQQESCSKEGLAVQGCGDTGPSLPAEALACSRAFGRGSEDASSRLSLLNLIWRL